MSTGSRTQMASIPGNESTRDTDMPHSTQHSALLYLFQEVSKLASPINDSLSRTNSWVNDATQGAGTTGADEEETNSQKIFSKPCQHGLPHTGHNCQEDKAKDKSSTVTTVVQSHVEGNSPWRVLSLINLQCERLLHHTDGGESDRSFDSSCAKLSHSVNRVPNAITNVSDQDGAGVCISVECTLRPSFSGREEEQTPPCFSPVQGTCSTEVGCLKPECCVKDSTLGCRGLSKTAAQLDICRPVLVEENAPAASQTYCMEQNIAKVTSSKNSLPQTACLPNFPPCVCQILNSNADASVVLPVGTLASDHNANLVLIAAPPCDAQRYPLNVQWSSLSIGTSDVCEFPPVQSDKVAASSLECTSVSVDESKDAGACLTSSSHGGANESSLASQPEPSTVQTERDADPDTKRQRTKTPRKQPHPSRSVDIRDPDFQGVTFRIDAELDDSREQCRLLITSKYR